MRSISIYLAINIFLFNQPLLSTKMHRSANFLISHADYIGAQRLLKKILIKKNHTSVERSHFLWLLGICQVSLLEKMAAKKTFVKLLTVNHTFVPKPKTSPKILKIFAQAKKEFQKINTYRSIYKPQIILPKSHLMNSPMNIKLSFKKSYKYILGKFLISYTKFIQYALNSSLAVS